MWNALVRFVQRMDQEGRDKFARLASDEERREATFSQAAMMASLLGSLLAPLYFILYAVLILIFAGSAYTSQDAFLSIWQWLRLAYLCMMLGSIQGGALGVAVGWAQAQLWLGKRHKAGTVCVAGSALVAAAMALFEAQYYRPGFPSDQFVLLALLLFSPGYLAAIGVTAWGLRLLGGRKNG